MNTIQIIGLGLTALTLLVLFGGAYFIAHYESKGTKSLTVAEDLSRSSNRPSTDSLEREFTKILQELSTENGVPALKPGERVVIENDRVRIM